MRLSRRQFLRLAGAAGAAGALVTAPKITTAQVYPSRPVRIVVGFPPGGTTDVVARLIAQSLSERLEQPFVVENKPGANANIAAEAVVRAPADGYTLLMLTVTQAINATLYEKLNYDVVRDLAPVASVASSPLVMEVNTSLPTKTVREFITYAKANPGGINMASAGNGTSSHLAGEMFKMMTGVSMLHVPYRGGAPALTDMLGGQVQVMFAVLPEVIEQIRAGKLRALAVTSAARSEALPDVPCVNEFVPGFEASYWAGIATSKNTPTAVIDRLNAGVNAALADPRTKARLAELGSMELGGSATGFGTLTAEEIQKWAKVIKLTGIKAE
jgi:tripartite-type tricarboxylate transporter receptor subunit TctC